MGESRRACKFLDDRPFLDAEHFERVRGGGTSKLDEELQKTILHDVATHKLCILCQIRQQVRHLSSLR